LTNSFLKNLQMSSTDQHPLVVIFFAFR